VSLEDLARQLELISVRMSRGDQALVDLEFLRWEAQIWPHLFATSAATKQLADAWSRYAEWLSSEGRMPEASEYAGRALNLVVGNADGRSLETLARCGRAYAAAARASCRQEAPLRVLAWLRKWLPPQADPELENAMYHGIADAAGLSVPPLAPSVRSG
jgi:hypothetical protein